MGLNYVDFYWLSQKSLIEIKIQDGMQGPLSNDINQRMVGKHGGGDFESLNINIHLVGCPEVEHGEKSSRYPTTETHPHLGNNFMIKCFSIPSITRTFRRAPKTSQVFPLIKTLRQNMKRIFWATLPSLSSIKKGRIRIFLEQLFCTFS